MAKPILISGVQPTGRLHLGNYLGALKNFTELQNSGKYSCLFFIADLHSLTENPKPDELEKNILLLTRQYLAGGLSPEKSLIFQQSRIPEHSDLMYFLATIAPEGDLKRMTQYKDKVTVKKYEANAGLLIYPLLMAADILLYDAKFVPVGEDQVQHLEFTRRLARKFNKKAGNVFVEPTAILTKAPRVMSLDNPEIKMSKSRPAGCLFLDDSEKEIFKKIKGAVTDSGTEIKYDPKKKKAVSNLVSVYSEISGLDIEEVENRFAGKNYGAFKESLAELLVEKLTPFREVKTNDKKAGKILDEGTEKARKMAESKIKEVKKKIGLFV